METVKPHLAADAIAFLDHQEDIRCVLSERSGHKIDIAGKLVMTDERLSERAAESKTFMEDDRYETLVRVVPQYL